MKVRKEPPYRLVGRFYGEVRQQEPVCIQMEVIGGSHGSRKCKMILQAYAPSQADLASFWHNMHDAIQKRIPIKDYMDETPVIHVHGDYVGGSRTEIRDSVVQDSKL